MKILREKYTPGDTMTAPGRVILVDLEDESYDHPIVTWWENLETGGRSSGHYFERSEIVLAIADFFVRATRGY